MNKESNKKKSQERIRALFKASSVQYIFSARHASHRAIIVSNRSGNYQLHAIDFNTGFTRQVTHTKQGKLFGSISADGRYIYILNDKDGSEYGHFVREPFVGGPVEDITSDMITYFSYSVSTSDDGKTSCFIATLDNRNNVFVVDEDESGAHMTKKKYSSEHSLSEPICSSDGTLVCISETNDKTRLSALLLLSKDTLNAVRSRNFAGITPLAFSTTKSKTILALTRTRDWYRPVFYDFVDDCMIEVKCPSFRGDVRVLQWDEGRDQMILCDVYQAEQKLYLYNTRTKKLKRIGPKIGSFNFHFDSIASLKDGSIVVKWNDFNTPSHLINIRAPHYDAWEKILEWSSREKHAYVVEHKWARASDNEHVHMLIVRPRTARKPIPFVIDIHGGPHGVAVDEYSPEAHSWLQRGFGYCAVNYRGSIGFGRKFERKIYGHPGKWEVEDVVAAREWLVQRKYADKEQIVLYGWSWGGYVTLLALGKYPDLWHRGIAGASIADCIMQYEDESAYFKTQDREIFKGTPETNRARYIESSPSTYAHRIQAPILLLHGKNDARCPARQIKYFVEVLCKLKKHVAVEWFASGHTGEFTETILRIRLIKKAIQFADNTKKKHRPRICLERHLVGW